MDNRLTSMDAGHVFVADVRGPQGVDTGMLVMKTHLDKYLVLNRNDGTYTFTSENEIEKVVQHHLWL